MIPTMGLQSDVIGFRFGFGYEKGKRTLRAMSNEVFNKLDEVEEQAIYKRHESTAINFFTMELINWVKLQNKIIESAVEIEMAKAQRTPSATAEVISSFYTGVNKLGKQTGQTISWNQLAKILFGPILSIFIPDKEKLPDIIPDIPTQIPPKTGGTSPGDTSPHIPPKEDFTKKIYTFWYSYIQLSKSSLNNQLTRGQVTSKRFKGTEVDAKLYLELLTKNMETFLQSPDKVLQAMATQLYAYVIFHFRNKYKQASGKWI